MPDWIRRIATRNVADAQISLDLEQAGGAHAAADAHGHHGIACTPRRLPSISAWPVMRAPLMP